MGINMASIMRKVNAFAKSSAGKKKIAGVTGGTGEGFVDLEARRKEMIEASQEMLAILKKHAASAGLPASVMEHVESFAASAPSVNDDGSGSVAINMTSDPSRPSLCPERYGGVDNIVAIFNNGYEASNYVYGNWANHEQTGKVSKGRTQEGSAYVRSRKQRDGLGFMQSAVAEFNASCGAKYNVTAFLGGPYG